MIFSEQTWTGIDDLLKVARVAAILPCGATEAHGPHLPLNTDVIIAEGMAHRAAALLRKRDVTALVLPSLHYAPAEYAAAFPGTISIGVEVAKTVMLDIARSVQRQGVAVIGLANAHFDPANVAMLREAAQAMSAIGLAVAFPDFTRRTLAQTLTREFISGACHAGQFETSLVLAERPDLVDRTAALGLAENPSSLTDAFTRGAKTFAEAGGPQAYFGAPAAASAEEGEASFAIMARALADAVVEALG
ncbi:MAG: creatininase family protein [Terricaulis sp.]